MDFHFETSIDRPRDDVFEFFSNPGNLQVVFADQGSFRMLRHDGHIRPGAQTWVEVGALLVLPIVMGFEHDAHAPPHSFSEHLIHGPFRRFEHLHEFEDRGDATRIRDTLRIELPWQYGGRVGMAAIVRRIVEQMFRIRQQGVRRALLRA